MNISSYSNNKTMEIGIRWKILFKGRLIEINAYVINLCNNTWNIYTQSCHGFTTDLNQTYWKTNISSAIYNF